MVEAQPDVAETQPESHVQSQEEDSSQEAKELSSSAAVTIMEPLSLSSTPSPQIHPQTVSDEVDPVAMDTEDAEPEVQTEEASDRTPPPAPQAELPSISDTDDRAGQSDDEDEDEDEHVGEELLEESLSKDDSQAEGDQKQEAEGEASEAGIKSELLLDELSNMSHGDESSSGFLGSPAEGDSQMLCSDLGLMPACRLRSDSLLTETDDSLPFDPLKCDGEKLKRRGSPGRSRVKQVDLSQDTFVMDKMTCMYVI